MPVILQVTGKCNLDCNFCLDEYKQIKEAPLSVWKKIIDEHKGERLYITGGEPMMYKDFDALMLYIREKKLKVRINSNGLTALQLVKYKDIVEEVIISLHNANEKDAHNFLGEGEQFNHATDAIRLLTDQKFNVKVATIVANTNKTKIKNIVPIIKEHNVNTWLFRQYIDTNNNEEMVIKNTEFFKFIDPIIEEFLPLETTVRFTLNAAESDNYIQYKPDGKKED